MGLTVIHSVLFNAQILFSLALGVWATGVYLRDGSISGNFWGAVATLTILNVVTLLIGIVLTAMGLRVQRTTVYFLYMAWLVVIMPGLFSLLRGRDDRNAALAFAILASFNFFVGLSMTQRGLVGPWLPV